MSSANPFGVLGALLATFGALALAVHLLKRLQRIGPGGRRGVPLRLLQRISVGPKQGIALVRVADRVLVCSIGDAGTSMLTELSDRPLAEALAHDEPAAALPAPGGRPAFGPMLARALRGFGLGPTAVLLALLVAPGLARSQTPTPAPANAAAPATSTRRVPLNTTSPAPAPTSAARAALPGLDIRGPLPPVVEVRMQQGNNKLQLDGAVGIVVFLGFLTLLPALFLLMTSFTRILIVLHFLRSALGTQTTPPGTLLVAIAVLLTGVVMNPVLQETQKTALQPYFDGHITQVEAYQRGVLPFREFMLKNTRDKDLALFAGLSGNEEAESAEDLPIATVVSAFVTSELRTAFQMGFVIYLPFVVVDVIVASVLMSLGMFMLPPAMISLPFKLLLFVLADGWALVVQNLVASFR